MKDNVTRFVVLSRDPLVATDALASTVPYKTSIVFSLQEVRGTARVLLLVVLCTCSMHCSSCWTGLLAVTNTPGGCRFAHQALSSFYFRRAP